MRRPRKLALAALAPMIAGLLVVAVGASPAEAKVVKRPAPTISVARPMPGEQFTLSGNLGKSVGRFAILQKKTGGRWAWSKKKWIPKSGKYSFTVTQPAASQQWRVLAKKKGKKNPPRQSAIRTVTLANQSAALTAPQIVRSGAGVLLTASFFPGRPGRPVQFQVDDGTGWRAIANGKQGAGGSVQYLWTSGAQTVAKFRAITSAQRGAAEFITPLAQSYVISKAPAVTGHRGWSGQWPENTLLAYNGALLNGADILETDFQRTAPDTAAESFLYKEPADGSLTNTATETTVANPDYCAAPDAVGLNGSPGSTNWKQYLSYDAATGKGKQHFIGLHDADFARTTDVLTKFPIGTYPGLYTDGQPKPEKFTLCQIKTLDAGSWKSKVAPTAGQPVPSLEETLDLLTSNATYTARHVMLEPKLADLTNGEARALYDDILAYDAVRTGNPTTYPGYQPFVPLDPAVHTDRALFDTFNFKIAADLIEHSEGAAEVATIADSLADAANGGDETDPANSPEGTVAILVNDSLVTPERINRIHAAGLQVIVWTVNAQARWFELAALGVDGIITDNPKGMDAQFAAIGL